MPEILGRTETNSLIVVVNVVIVVANVSLRLFAHSFKPFHCLSVLRAGPEHVAGQDITTELINITVCLMQRRALHSTRYTLLS